MSTEDTNANNSGGDLATEPKLTQDEQDLPPTSSPTQEGRQLHGFKWVLVISSVLTSTFLFGLDTTIVADIQPAIVGEFNSLDRLPWISVAFLLLSASTTLFWFVSHNHSLLFLGIWDNMLIDMKGSSLWPV